MLIIYFNSYFNAKEKCEEHISPLKKQKQTLELAESVQIENAYI
jgi:hypothetical protein